MLYWNQYEALHAMFHKTQRPLTKDGMIDLKPHCDYALVTSELLEMAHVILSLPHFVMYNGTLFMEQKSAISFARDNLMLN
jgi:hypothetical protein